MPVRREDDIFPRYRGTPIGKLLEYHNLEAPLQTYDVARLLIGMCMDHRKMLRLPENFAYILRAGGANLRQSEFKISFAIGIGGVRHIALIGHNQCGMVNLAARRDQFVQGMVERAGWTEEQALQHFELLAPTFEIGHEVDFVLAEAARLRACYPGVVVAPMLFLVEDQRLYLLEADR